MATSLREAPARPQVRRWPRRLVIGLCIFVAVCILLAGGGYAYLLWRYGQIPKIHFSNHELTQDTPGGSMNVLLVGSDSRARLTGAAARQAGKGVVTGQRSDTIMILHVDPKEKKAAIISIPRDLYVPIYGTNRRDRINSAFEDSSGGGPQRLIRTITSVLGVPINHYIEVDFVGFRDIVDAVGGVKIYVPARARDLFSGLNITNPGCINFDGGMALAWVRSRHYEYYEAGRWREDPNSDLSRIQRQQDFIRRMLKKAISTGLTNPVQLNKLIGIGVKDVTIDSALSRSDIEGLGRRFHSLDPDAVDMLTLPTVPFVLNGADYLKLNESQLQAYIDRLNGNAQALGPGTAPADVRPGAVRVRVLNGTGGESLAGKVSLALETVGFSVADRGDAPTFKNPKTIIRYAPASLAKAQLLQQYLQGGSQLVQDNTLRTVDVTLVVGADYAGVRARPLAPKAGSSSSHAPATGTTLPPPPPPVPIPKGAPPAPPCG